MNGEHTKFWQSNELGSSFEVLVATYVTHTFTRHTHEGFAIGVIERGGESFYYRGQNHNAPPGSVVVICPGEVHTGQAITAQGWTYRMLYPNAELLARAASEVAGEERGIPFFNSPVIYDPVLFENMRQTHNILEQSASALERETRLLWTLIQLVRRHADQRLAPSALGSEHNALVQAQHYLQTHYAEDISLETLALVAHLSPFHLSRLFRERLGLPPHAYLNQIRINRAKEQLNVGRSIAETALATGFVDQSHLNKAFKRIVGVTPGQYRKILQDETLPTF
ncbi:MAG: AraC family transcriptional regulator [Anaerolineae bacterium]